MTGAFGKQFEENFDRWLNQIHAVVEEVNPGCVSDILDHYFTGGPPFRKLKNREDFPDAFIFEIVKSVAAQQAQLFVVVADGALREAIATVPKTQVFDTLDNFIESAEVQNLYPDNFVRNNTRELLEVFEWDTRLMDRALLDAAQVEIVDSKGLRRRDDEDADIVDLGAVVRTDYDFGRARYYGQNIFRVPFEAELEGTLDYFLLKSTYYEMPDEECDDLEIQEPDWNASYMWVREDVVLEVSGMLAISIDIPHLIANSQPGHIDNESVKDHSEITIDQVDEIGIKDDL